jgi:hypothetical protein
LALERARAPFAVVSAFDHAGLRQALLLAPPEMLREGEALLAVQAQAAGDTPFAPVTGWRRLDQPGAPRHRASPLGENEE